MCHIDFLFHVSFLLFAPCDTLTFCYMIYFDFFVPCTLIPFCLLHSCDFLVHVLFHMFNSLLALLYLTVGSNLCRQTITITFVQFILCRRANCSFKFI